MPVRRAQQQQRCRSERGSCFRESRVSSPYVLSVRKGQRPSAKAAGVNAVVNVKVCVGSESGRSRRPDQYSEYAPHYRREVRCALTAQNSRWRSKSNVKLSVPLTNCVTEVNK